MGAKLVADKFLQPQTLGILLRTPRRCWGCSALAI
ncbi:hypothetical protein [Salmonella enterica]|nr:hypothetical protein [Salmonella enterica]